MAAAARDSHMPATLVEPQTAPQAAPRPTTLSPAHTSLHLPSLLATGQATAILPGILYFASVGERPPAVLEVAVTGGYSEPTMTEAAAGGPLSSGSSVGGGGASAAAPSSPVAPVIVLADGERRPLPRCGSPARCKRSIAASHRQRLDEVRAFLQSEDERRQRAERECPLLHSGPSHVKGGSTATGTPALSAAPPPPSLPPPGVRASSTSRRGAGSLAQQYEAYCEWFRATHDNITTLGGLLTMPDRATGTTGAFFVSVAHDPMFHYRSYFADFGPLELRCLVVLAARLTRLLAVTAPGGLAHSDRDGSGGPAGWDTVPVVVCAGPGTHERANIGCLLGGFTVAALGWSAEQAYTRFLGRLYPPLATFRDASGGASSYPLSVLDVLAGLERAVHLGWWELAQTTFLYPVEERRGGAEERAGGQARPGGVYRRPPREAPCEFESSWIIPYKLLAFPSAEDAVPTRTAALYARQLRARGVTLVVQLNGTLQEEKRVEAASPLGVLTLPGVATLGAAGPHTEFYDPEPMLLLGIDHVRHPFPDGTTPCDAVLKAILQDVENAFGERQGGGLEGRTAGGAWRGLPPAVTASIDPPLCGTAGLVAGKRGRDVRPGGTRVTTPPLPPTPTSTAHHSAPAYRQRAVVAIHCRAGLGRTGTVIAVYLMRHYGFTARAAMGWLRLCRPGSVTGVQQQYLEAVERRLAPPPGVMEALLAERHIASVRAARHSTRDGAGDGHATAGAEVVSDPTAESRGVGGHRRSGTPARATVGVEGGRKSFGRHPSIGPSPTTTMTTTANAASTAPMEAAAVVVLTPVTAASRLFYQAHGSVVGDPAGFPALTNPAAALWDPSEVLEVGARGRPPSAATSTVTLSSSVHAAHPPRGPRANGGGGGGSRAVESAAGDGALTGSAASGSLASVGTTGAMHTTALGAGVGAVVRPATAPARESGLPPVGSSGPPPSPPPPPPPAPAAAQAQQRNGAQQAPAAAAAAAVAGAEQRYEMAQVAALLVDPMYVPQRSLLANLKYASSYFQALEQARPLRAAVGVQRHIAARSQQRPRTPAPPPSQPQLANVHPPPLTAPAADSRRSSRFSQTAITHVGSRAASVRRVSGSVLSSSSFLSGGAGEAGGVQGPGRGSLRPPALLAARPSLTRGPAARPKRVRCTAPAWAAPLVE